jgi:aspartate racemase
MIVRTIGLIGGMSWQSSAEYYRAINQGVQDRLGPLHSAAIVMESVDFAPIALAQREGRWDDAALPLAAAARRLEAAGAGCVVLCTNTMHKVADRLRAAITIPFIHIADPVGAAARAAGFATLGLLGTAFTMTEPFIVRHLEQHHGLTVLTPPADDIAAVHRIIYDELCVGVIRAESLRVYQDVIERLRQRGAQAVVLGCTEIGLLVKPGASRVPLLDSTLLHAQAAVDFALGEPRPA